MGREIRRVIPNWEHPKETNFDVNSLRQIEAYIPMHDESCQDAWDDWQELYQAYLTGGREKLMAEFDYSESDLPKHEPYKCFVEYDGHPPNSRNYRPSWDEHEATWYQVYETVSEGTPVSPPFETQQELIEYLAVNGDFWDQRRRKEGNLCITSCSPWPRKQAEKFVLGTGHAVSFVVTNGVIKSGVESL